MSEPEVLFAGKLFDVVRRVQMTRNGSTHVREVVRHPGAVAILPILDDGRICLIRNRRISIDRELIELPAGTLNRNEHPDACAVRELREETGYRAGTLKRVLDFWTSPGILTERMHLYIATSLEPGSPNLETGEEIETLLVTWNEAMQLIGDGHLQDAKTLVGLLYYDRFHRGR